LTNLALMQQITRKKILEVNGYDSGTIRVRFGYEKKHDMIFHKAGAVDSDLGSRALFVAMLLPKHQVLATSKRHEISTTTAATKGPDRPWLPLGLQPKSPWQSHQRFYALHSMCQGQSVFALANSGPNFGSQNLRHDMELSGDGLALDTPLNSRLVRIQPSQKKYICIHMYRSMHAQYSTKFQPKTVPKFLGMASASEAQDYKC
jgi:hypothetical protein